MTGHNFLLGSRLRDLGFTVLALGMALALGDVRAASGAKPPHCSDVPISVSFAPTTLATAAIWNDLPNLAYENGVNGVAAVIHYGMSCDGTRDATLNLGGSSRTLMMQYPAPIPGSIIVAGPPSFAEGSAFATKAFFNVHNVIGNGLPSGTTTYYTKVTSTFTGPDNNQYRLALFPDGATCPPGGLCAPVQDGTDPYINQPSEAAWAKVTYTPRDPNQAWSMTNTDSWAVDGELTDPTVERATLLLIPNHGAFIHNGQYSLPFKITITALAPLH